jgi:hypothetical protein
MNNNLLLKIFILVFTVACSKAPESSEGIKRIDVSFDKRKESVKMSDMVASVNYIPLITSDDVLINEISKVVNDGEFIYVADRLSLYKFSLDGVFICKIQKNGPGPDEYLSISDFQIDNNGLAWILSQSNKKIINYSWDGEMIGLLELDIWVNSFYFMNDDRVFLYCGNETDNNEYRLNTIDLKTKEPANSFLKIDSHKSTYLHLVGSTNHFFNFQDKIRFYEIFNDTIYSIEKNNITPYLYLNIDNKNIPPSFYEDDYANIADFFQNLFTHSYGYGIKFFFENENSYITSYYYDKECYLNITAKNNAHSYNIKTIHDDMELYNYPINFTDLTFFPDKNGLLIVAYPNEIMDYANENLSKEACEKIKEKIKYTSEDQNPLIIRLIVKI